MALDAGSLDLRVRIEAETRVSNGQGGHVTQWALVKEVWSRKRPLRGDETVREGIIRATASARFTIRYRAGVTTEHRLVEKRAGTVWNIRSADDPDGGREQLDLVCESGVPT